MSESADSPTRSVGRVTELWRFPVKSMAGEHLEEAQLGWHGVTGDRRWAFVRGDTPRSGFPWLTIREEPPLAQYRPYLRDRARPDRSETWVRTPDGDELDVIDPALAAGLAPGARPGPDRCTRRAIRSSTSTRRRWSATQRYSRRSGASAIPVSACTAQLSSRASFASATPSRSAADRYRVPSILASVRWAGVQPMSVERASSTE